MLGVVVCCCRRLWNGQTQDWEGFKALAIFGASFFGLSTATDAVIDVVAKKRDGERRPVMYLDLFNECVRGRWYNQTTGKVDWKIVDGLMFFRQSVESQDWIRNFLAAIPIPVYLKAWQWVPLGAWLTYSAGERLHGKR